MFNTTYVIVAILKIYNINKHALSLIFKVLGK
jgi:hypothetical protein